MSESLPEGANRVQDFLILKDSNSKVRLLPESTATAKEAAATLGVELYQIGKSIVLGNINATVVAVICGDKKVDVNLLSKELKLLEIKSLTAEEVKRRTGFVIGGVSPFSLSDQIIIVIDSRLFNLDKCYVAAGHPKAVVETSGKEILSITESRVLSICS